MPAEARELAPAAVQVVRAGSAVQLAIGGLLRDCGLDGTGAQAKIHKYKEVGPGEHVDGVEQILYPLNPPHH